MVAPKNEGSCAPVPYIILLVNPAGLPVPIYKHRSTDIEVFPSLEAAEATVQQLSLVTVCMWKYELVPWNHEVITCQS